MSRSEKVELTAMCMVWRGDEILVQDRVKEDWRGVAFPGGHIERGESFVEGIRREMREETGLDVRGLKLCGIKQFPTQEGERYVVLLFKASEFEGELHSSDEGRVRWIKRADLAAEKTVDDFDQLLRVMDEEEWNEMLYERREQFGKEDWLLTLH